MVEEAPTYLFLQTPKPQKGVFGQVCLNGSKSISNRVLIIYALADTHFELSNLSNSKDTCTLLRLLTQADAPILDAGDAGTTYRFLTAFLAFREGKQVLTGSARMLERPIAPLVDALKQLGAAIQYIGKEGYPPILINPPNEVCNTPVVNIPAHISSQFVSALLLVAPTLPQGICVRLEGQVVSQAYIQMSLDLMQAFGIEIAICKQRKQIYIPAQKYQARPWLVEADWSAASYYYSIMAFSPEGSKIFLKGIQLPSIQGDSVLAKLMEQFGVETQPEGEGCWLCKKTNHSLPNFFSYDFIQAPDIAQTLAVLCAGLNIPARLEGLQTLQIKETERITALHTELTRLGAVVQYDAQSLDILQGIPLPLTEPPSIRTYGDHRMAMAFAPLACILPAIRIENPNVVEKSYPDFWTDLELLGFKTNKK
jgi:3-phosphoshikimate 1-carboxyvinyltransferase